MTRILFAAVLAATFCVPTHAAAQHVDMIARYGLRKTHLHRQVATDAVALVNSVLRGWSNLSIAAHWEKSDDASVRLYWVGSRNLSTSHDDMMFVMAECLCVVVQPAVFHHWLAQYSGEREGSELDLRDPSPPHILAFFLLHEIGHIAHEHKGRAIIQEGGHGLNLTPSASKEREALADRYAADAIANATSDEQFERSLPAHEIQFAVGTLAWNLMGIRVIDNFGITPLNPSEVLLDSGTSHHNLELRVLEIRHRMLNTPESAKTLESFREKRRQSMEREPLYRRPRDPE